MSKPKKTMLQLETLIKKEAAKSMLLPKDIVVSIWPDTDGKSRAAARTHCKIANAASQFSSNGS
jgi:hypothetical protein